MIYNHLINSFLNSYNNNSVSQDTINFVNVSFHPYNSVLILKELKSKISLYIRGLVSFYKVITF
jgi:hypothetical protein